MPTPHPIDLHDDADAIQNAYAASVAAMFDKLIDIYASDGEAKFKDQAQRYFELRRAVRDKLIELMKG